MATIRAGRSTCSSKHEVGDGAGAERCISIGAMAQSRPVCEAGLCAGYPSLANEGAQDSSAQRGAGQEESSL
eukprot:scaffold168163_cov32-Tisochrysis_lutea.AAC.2